MDPTRSEVGTTSTATNGSMTPGSAGPAGHLEQKARRRQGSRESEIFPLDHDSHPTTQAHSNHVYLIDPLPTV